MSTPPQSPQQCSRSELTPVRLVESVNYRAVALNRFESIAAAVMEHWKRLHPNMPPTIGPPQLNDAMSAVQYHTQQMRDWLADNGHNPDEVPVVPRSPLPSVDQQPEEPQEWVNNMLESRYEELKRQREELQREVRTQENTVNCLCAELQSQWTAVNLKPEHYLHGRMEHKPGASLTGLMLSPVRERALDHSSVGALRASVLRFSPRDSRGFQIIPQLPETLILRCVARLFSKRDGASLIPGSLAAAARLGAVSRYACLPISAVV
jgi:hypothetical protein